MLRYLSALPGFIDFAKYIIVYANMFRYQARSQQLFIFRVCPNDAPKEREREREAGALAAFWVADIFPLIMLHVISLDHCTKPGPSAILLEIGSQKIHTRI